MKMCLDKCQVCSNPHWETQWRTYSSFFGDARISKTFQLDWRWKGKGGGWCVTYDNTGSAKCKPVKPQRSTKAAQFWWPVKEHTALIEWPVYVCPVQKCGFATLLSLREYKEGGMSPLKCAYKAPSKEREAGEKAAVSGVKLFKNMTPQVFFKSLSVI